METHRFSFFMVKVILLNMSWNSLICFNIPRDRKYEAHFQSLLLNHIFFSKVFLNYGFGGFSMPEPWFSFFFKHHIFILGSH